MFGSNKWFLGCVALVACVGTIAAADLSVTTGIQNVHGGRSTELELTFHNRAQTVFQGELHFRVFQLSRGLYAPVGAGRKWRTIEVPADASRRFTFGHAFPEVRAATGFKVVWFTKDGTRLADFIVTAQPQDLLEPLRSLGDKKLLGLWDPDEKLIPHLRELKVEPEVMRSRWNAEDFRGEVLIVVHSPKQELRLDEKLVVFERLNRNRVSVICLLPDQETPLPLTVNSTGKANIVFAAARSLSRFGTHADDHVLLLKLLKLARHPNPSRILIDHEK